MRYLRSFSVSEGSIGAERAPEEQEDLYVTGQELAALFGCARSDADIRFAMAIINSHCNRPSLWPVEIDSNTIQIPSDRQETRLPVTPVIRIVETGGRYSRGRRDRIGYNNILYNYGATLLALQGSIPQWQPIDVSLLSVDAATGVVWMPTGTMLWAYGSFRCKYIAGYTDVPYRVKACIAEIINNVKSRNVSDRIRHTVGRVTNQFASNSFVTPQAEAFLSPFVIREYV